MVSTCIAASGVFAVARPNQGKAAKAPKRAGSKLWMPKSAAVDSPRIIVEGDKENKMAGLTELRKEVIMDMEDFAQNEVRAADTPPASIHAPRGAATPSFFSPTLTWPVGRRPESSSCKKMARGSRGVAASRVLGSPDGESAAAVSCLSHPLNGLGPRRPREHPQVVVGRGHRGRGSLLPLVKV